nr:hypothetical protein [uncultured Acidovorax sp.]
MLRLRSWPDLRNAPDELVPDIVRICALLAMRPTGAPLIHQLLGLPRARVEMVIDVLHVEGHLNDGSPFADRPAHSRKPSESSSAKEAPSLISGFLDRFRKKLLLTGAR